MKRLTLTAALIALSASAHAVDGEVLITQAKALAGGVVPGDAPGFPVTIAKSGKYKLSSDLVIADGNTDVIEVTAANVDIDLNGFGIYGPNTCNGDPVTGCDYLQGGQAGVYAYSVSDIKVKNGTIQGMSSFGLRLDGSSVVENVDVSRCGHIGIFVKSGLVRNVLSHHNLSTGVSFNAHGVLSGSTIISNGADGVSAGKGVLVTGNTINNNHNFGIVGYAIYNGTNGYSNNVIIGNAGGKTVNMNNLGGNL